MYVNAHTHDAGKKKYRTRKMSKKRTSSDAFFFEMPDNGKKPRGGSAAVTASSSSSPIPFIVHQEDCYTLTPESVTFLQGLDSSVPIAVLAVAGLYRTGKSSLLNLLFHEELGGRQVKSSCTVNSCTKGVWLAGRPIPIRIEGRQVQLLIIDTEGLGSSDSHSSHDSNIFALSLLLSSMFCYNSIGAIDDNALTALSTTLSVAQIIQKSSEKKSEGSSSGAAAAAPPAFEFPNFLWLVRDFSLRIMDRTGRSISEKDYIESILTHETTDSGKQHTRRTIMDLFPRRDCVTLVRPCDKEEHLQDLGSSLANPNLRREFVQQMSDLKRRLLRSVRPMAVGGVPMTPGLYVRLTGAYVESINRGAAPQIEHTWFLVCKQENARLAEELRERCRRDVAGLSTMPEINDLVERCVRDLRNRCIGEPGEIVDRFRAEVLRDAETALENARLKRREELAERFKAVESTVLSFVDLTEVRGAFDECIDRPDAYQVAYSHVWSAVERFYYTRDKRAMEKAARKAEEIAALEKRVVEAQASHGAAEATIASLREDLERAAAEAGEKESAMQTLRRKLREEEARRERENADLRSQVESECRERARQQASHEAVLSQSSLSAQTATDSAASELAEARAGLAVERQTSDGLREELERERERLEGLEAQLQEQRRQVEAGRLARNSVKELQEEVARLRRQNVELQRSSKETAEKADEDAKQIQKQAMETVDSIQGVLDAERIRAKKTKQKLSDKLTRAEETAEATKQRLEEENEALRLQMANQRTKYEELQRAKERERAGAHEEIDRYSEMLRENSERLASQRRDMMARIQEATAKAGQKEVELIAEKARVGESYREKVRDAELRAATAEAKLEAAVTRKQELEEKTRKMRTELSGTAETAQAVAGLEAELTSVRDQKDAAYGRAEKAEARARALEDQLTSAGRQKDQELMQQRLGFERRLSVLQSRLLEMEEDD